MNTRVLTNFWTEDFLPAQPVYAEPVQILWKMAVLFTVQKLARFHRSRVLQNADLCKFFCLKIYPHPNKRGLKVLISL